MTRRFSTRSSVAGALAVLAACAVPGASPLALSPAIPSEYSPYQAPGHAVVAGQAFLTQQGGGVVRAAGAAVTLDPATSLARQWCAAVCADRGWRKQDIADSVFLGARRTAIADADGRFTFSNVPPGRYLVRTGVIWRVGYETQGGMLAEIVTVPDTGRVDVVMSTRGNPFERVSR